MEKLDYKKAYKDLYLPKQKPAFITVPPIPYITIQGTGNPNQENGAYKDALEILYGITFTLKMIKLQEVQPAGYFDYVLPPLEGMWWMEGEKDIDFTQKDNFHWISMIRLPAYVDEEVFHWACEQLKKKKPLIDFTKAGFQIIEEGECVQAMHIGSYDDEPTTITSIEQSIKDNGYHNDIGSLRADGTTRLHHELYLSDPRKTAPEKLKTVIRIPVRK